MKTRKKREKTGENWARYGLRSVNKEGRGGITWEGARLAAAARAAAAAGVAGAARAAAAGAPAAADARAAAPPPVHKYVGLNRIKSD